MVKTLSGICERGLQHERCCGSFGNRGQYHCMCNCHKRANQDYDNAFALD